MKKGIRNTIITIALIIVLIIIFFIATDRIIFDKNKKMNLVINNNNITANLKNDVVIENDIIYVSEADIQNFFDKHLSEIDGKIVTTYDKKIAELSFTDNEIDINGSKIETNAHARKGDNGEVYLPISEMKDVYGIEIEVNQNTKVITIDSLDREQKKCTATKSMAVKSSTGPVSKTLARVNKGDSVIKINDTQKGWTRVRTQDGKIGYVKTKKLANEITVRENLEEEKQVEGKINMFWDYFSESEKAPDRSGTDIEGVNVVSPTFFYIDKAGNLQENVGEMGERYIKWAHNSGYKIWPIVSNAGENMTEVTSTIMNDYQKRKELIERNSKSMCKI